jgi:hypothetical protein
MRTKLTKLGIVFLFLLIFACLFATTTVKVAGAVDWWPMFQHDLVHTGTTSSTSPNTNQTLWVTTLGGAVRSCAAVLDGVVYVGCFGGNVYALNAYTGATIWSYPTGADVWSTPAVANGKVY